jgi:processive 1,2-diacylglycerol beta-glucosyltransferase
MSRNELLILQCPAGGGHKAAAMALAERAQARGIPARVVDALSFAPPWFAKLYVDTHLRSSAYLPKIYGSAYFASNHRSAVDGELRKRFDHWLGRPLLEDVLARHPLAVVTTHFFPMLKLGWARRRGLLEAPLIEVITDYATHAVWAEPGADAYCAPHGRACSDLIRHGISPDLIVPTGIPVRTAFGAIPPIDPARRLRVLVTSGGFGVGPVSRVLRSLAPLPNLAVTVVCGQNAHLVARVKRMSSTLGLDANVIGFEREMPARIADSDVVVTKPGGLTVSECLAAGRPLILVGAVPGQESLNEAWVTEQGAGVACEPESVGATLERLARRALVAMGARARSLGAPDAVDRVIDVVLARSLGVRAGYSRASSAADSVVCP